MRIDDDTFAHLSRTNRRRWLARAINRVARLTGARGDPLAFVGAYSASAAHKGTPGGALPSAAIDCAYARRFVTCKVHEKNTTQKCSACGEQLRPARFSDVNGRISGRADDDHAPLRDGKRNRARACDNHSCPSRSGRRRGCRRVLDRDVNAALSMVALGLQQLLFGVDARPAPWRL